MAGTGPVLEGFSAAPLYVLLDISGFLQYAVNGLVVGSVLALSAVGLTLVYGILRIANFAHGDLLTLGAYLALYIAALVTLPSSLNWGLAVAALLVVFVLVERFVLRPLATRSGSGGAAVGTPALLSPRESAGLLLIALGLLALVVGIRVPARVAVQSALIVVFLFAAPIVFAVFSARGFRSSRLAPAALSGAGVALAYIVASRMLLGIALALALVAAFAVLFDVFVWRRARNQGAGLLSLIIMSIGLSLALRYGIQMLWGSSPRFFPGSFQSPRDLLGSGVLITTNQATTIVVAVVAIVLLHLLLRYTRTGKAMRALADNMELARVTGIDVDRVVLYVWIIGGSLAALAGILYAMLGAFTPNLGWFQILPIFAAVVLGGIGSPYGALVGGFTVGLVMETSVFFGVPGEYRLAVGFAVLILVLIVRPSGILGGAAAR